MRLWSNTVAKVLALTWKPPLAMLTWHRPQMPSKRW